MLIPRSLVPLALAWAATAQVSAVENPLPATSPLGQTRMGRPADALARYRALPLAFESYPRPSDEGFRFVSHSPGQSAFFSPAEIRLVLGGHPPHGGRETLRIRLLGANLAAAGEAGEELRGRSNYLLGKDASGWRRGVTRYARAGFRGVYPGVDLSFHGNQGRLEYDFTLAPGADPRSIRLSIEGASSVKIDGQGDLHVTTARGELVQHAPLLYQEDGRGRAPVAGRYVLEGRDRVGFAVSAYDQSRPLVIDPVLSYSSYLGGSGDDEIFSIAVDDMGAAYLTGRTYSANFPVETTGFDPVCSPENYCIDVFVVKLDPARNGSDQLVYSTFLGGNDVEWGFGIALDREGNAYVTGKTSSTDFPTTAGSFQASCNESPFGTCATGFVTKLGPDGASLVYSTFMGGGYNYGIGTAPFDECGGIAVGADGHAFVVGSTASSSFPTTPGAYQTAFGGARDAFVAELSADGASLVYATYLGGSSTESGYAIAVDSSGKAHVAGETYSDDFPVAHALQPSWKGNREGFVTTLDSGGSAAIFSTYLGGSDTDAPLAIDVDVSGATYVTGQTKSVDYPMANPIQGPNPWTSTYGGTFVSKIGPDGSALVYSTFLGGTGYNYGTAIKVDALGSAYVAGYGGFLTRLDPTGTAILDDVIIPGAGYPNALAIGPCATVYVGGATFSQYLPIVGGFQPRSGGSLDGFLIRLGDPSDCAFRIADASVGEGNGEPRAAVFTVSLPTPQTATVTVDYATVEGTAGDLADYTATSGTLTFAPGVTSQSIAVPVAGDTTFEDDETFFVRLSRSVNAGILRELARGTILNDDPPPSLSIDDASLEEGDSGARGARFTVSLSAPSGKPVVVRYAAANETAVAPGDFRGVSGTLTFPPGVTSQGLTVDVNGDTLFEKDETFLVLLGRRVGATISRREGRATIRNDDPAPSLSIGDVSLVEGNAGTREAVFTVSLSKASAWPTTASYATADGTAIGTAGARQDYVPATGTLTIAAGGLEGAIRVRVRGDKAIEPDEFFLVNLNNPANATIARDQGRATIVNDEKQASPSGSRVSSAR